MQPYDIHARLEAAYKLADQMSGQSGTGYLQNVVIDSRPEARPFRLVAREWQWERARKIMPALEALAGFRSDYSGPVSFCEILPRGHDKTTGLARCMNWLLGYSKRKLRLIGAAGDRDQAALITQSMLDEVQWNPWLKGKLKFNRNKVFGPGGWAEIISADAPSSYGLKADLYLLDEWTHWKDDKFWTSLLSGRAKIPNALFLILSNAGLKNTWQWEAVQVMQASPMWDYWEAPGQLDTWMSAEQIAEDRKLLPPAEARRLYDNVWIDPAEASGYLTREEIQSCADLGRQLGLTWTFHGRSGIRYWLSVDYGPKRDRTTCGVYHQEPSGFLVVDQMLVLQGSPESPVKIDTIRDWLESVRKNFQDCSLVVDPYQLEDLCQEYEQRMPVKRFEARGGKSNYEMAAKLRSIIVNKQIAWYAGMGSITLPNGRADTLEDELVSLVLRPMTYGYRFDHELTKHDDRAVNMGMAVVQMLEQMKPPAWVGPEQVVQPVQEKERPESVIDYLKQIRGGNQRLIYGIDPKRTEDKR